MRVRKPGSMPDIGLRQRMRLVQQEAARLREVEAETEKKIPGLDELEAVPHHESWKKLEPDYEPPEPLSTDRPGPGADLRERDLSGEDLSGLDLSGANLERANLSRARLRGACLRGAKLARAKLCAVTARCALFEARLYRAELASAKLGRAVIAPAKGAR